MRIIGLTGGIATGKSTVAALLRELGATVVDADELAHAVEQPGQAAFDEIVKRFGPEVVRPDGTLNRAHLGEVVFADEQARRDLEGITHPRVLILIAERVAEAAASGAAVVVVDIPLLYESDGGDRFEGVLLVYAPDDVQVQRLRERNSLSEHAARRRVAAQLPIEEKRQRATWVIDNSGDPHATRRQVAEWWRDVVRG